MPRKNEWYHVVGLLFAVGLILFGGAALSGSSGGFDWLITDSQDAVIDREAAYDHLESGR
jgi:hypothetical protein